MDELLQGPSDETLKRTIPAGTTMNSLYLEGTRAVVDLSTAYGLLSGIELTLADQSIALTLTQVPEIVSVKITVLGEELAYRDRQIFTGRDVLLAPEGDVVGTVDATLYFLFVRLAARSKQLDDPTAWKQAMEEALRDYREPVSGARERIENALRIMLIGNIASKMAQTAERMLDEL